MSRASKIRAFLFTQKTCCLEQVVQTFTTPSMVTSKSTVPSHFALNCEVSPTPGRDGQRLTPFQEAMETSQSGSIPCNPLVSNFFVPSLRLQVVSLGVSGLGPC